MSKKLTALCGTALLVGGLAGSALAQTVASAKFGVVTGGNWRPAYGQCLSIIPDPPNVEVENPVGPQPYSQGADYLACVNGPLAEQQKFDFRVFRTGVDANGNPQEKPALVWRYGAGYPINPGAAQLNLCAAGGPRYLNGTWDNENFVEAPNQTGGDPLVHEMTLKAGGQARVSYYFYEGIRECRRLQWELYVNDVKKAAVDCKGTSGCTSYPALMLEDFDNGRYLEFQLKDLNAAGTKIALRVSDGGSPAGQTCSAFNSVIGGAFVDGTDVCAPPPVCRACQGGLKSLTLKWLGSKAVRITVKRPDGPDADWAPDVIFDDDRIEPSETFTIVDKDGGPLGKYLYLYVNGYKVAILKGDCSQELGPGFQTYYFRVVEGTSVLGGELCPVKKYCSYHKKYDCKEHRFCPVHNRDHGDRDRCEYDRDDKDDHDHGADCDRDKDGKCDHPYDQRCKHSSGYVRGNHNHGRDCDKNRDGKCDHGWDSRCKHSKWAWSSWWW